jgi:hypothetical protein
LQQQIAAAPATKLKAQTAASGTSNQAPKRKQHCGTLQQHSAAKTAIKLQKQHSRQAPCSGTLQRHQQPSLQTQTNMQLFLMHEVRT